MVNPILFEGDTSRTSAFEDLLLPSTMVNGRSPDPVLHVQSGPMLERPRSPSDEDLQADCKRLWDQDSGGV
ncbi:hypothetical protein V6N13_059312 [Hibiscus sabdariffa]